MAIDERRARVSILIGERFGVSQVSGLGEALSETGFSVRLGESDIGGTAGEFGNGTRFGEVDASPPWCVGSVKAFQLAISLLVHGNTYTFDHVETHRHSQEPE